MFHLAKSPLNPHKSRLNLRGIETLNIRHDSVTNSLLEYTGGCEIRCTGIWKVY